MSLEDNSELVHEHSVLANDGSGPLPKREKQTNFNAPATKKYYSYNPLRRRKSHDVNMAMTSATTATAVGGVGYTSGGGSGEGTSHTSQQLVGRRLTVGSKTSGLSTANPQQGTFEDILSSKSFHHTGGGSRPSSRRGSHQSLASITDPQEDPDIGIGRVENNMTGLSLSNLMNDVKNPNQKMGLLLQQMRAMEEKIRNSGGHGPPPPVVEEQRTVSATNAAYREALNTRHTSIGISGSRFGAVELSTAGAEAGTSQRRVSTSSAKSDIRGETNNKNNNKNMKSGQRLLNRRFSNSNNKNNKNISSSKSNKNININTKNNSNKDNINKNSKDNNKDPNDNSNTNINNIICNSNNNIHSNVGQNQQKKSPSLSASEGVINSMHRQPHSHVPVASSSTSFGIVQRDLDTRQVSQLSTIPSLPPSYDKPKSRNKLSLSTTSICIGILLAFAVGGALAAACYFAFVIDGKGSNVAGGASSSGEFVFGLQTVSPTPSPQNYLDGPPLDIEGRCSPSNLPASLHACTAACSAATCCYPSLYVDTRKSCLDEQNDLHIDSCQKYRPYCDLVHDTWAGATEGVIRAAPANIVLMCVALGEVISANATEDNVPGQYVGGNAGNDTLGTQNESLERNRLRGHNDDTIPPHRRRRMNPADSPFQICHQYCVSAQCCHAPSDVAGLTISASGVSTNAVNGDYALTNCRAGGFGRNKVLCNEYDKFCDHAIDVALTISPTTPSKLSNGSVSNEPPVSSAPSFLINRTSSPTLLPKLSTSPTETLIPSAMPTVSTSPTETLIPTATPTVSTLPTDTSMPSGVALPALLPEMLAVVDGRPLSLPTHSPYPTFIRVLPAPSFEIAATCSGFENFEMISSNITTARDQCISACTNGLCCFAEQLGYGSWMQSCYNGNEVICIEYSPCLVLSKGGDNVNNSTADASFGGNNTSSSTTTSIGAVEAPPTPSYELATTPTQESPAMVGEELGLAVASNNVTEAPGGAQLTVETMTESVDELQADNATYHSSEEEEEAVVEDKAASSLSGGDNVNEE